MPSPPPRGRQIVVGGPGTGKTEFLVRRVLFLIEELGVPAPELLVLGFGRRGTADLQQRIRPDCPVRFRRSTSRPSIPLRRGSSSTGPGISVWTLRRAS